MNVIVFRILSMLYGLARLSIAYALVPASLAEGLRSAGIGSPHWLNRLSRVATDVPLENHVYISTNAM